MGREATLYLLERGVRLTGTDAWSWDAPFGFTAKSYAKTKDASLIWEGHKAGRDIGYCHLEKLTNLDSSAGHRLLDLLLSREDRGRVRRLDARGGNPPGLGIALRQAGDGGSGR